jgi:hypothetical protein
MPEWWPEAKREPATSNGGTFNGGSPKGMLHTTEGGSYETALSVYRRKGYWPHATLTFQRGRFECYQHLPLSVAGKTLAHPKGTGDTNRNNVIQCEIVGSADPRWAHCKKLLFVKDFPREYLDGIAAWMRFVEGNHGVARSAPFAFPGRRLDWPAWNAASGWLGHTHVPHNNHFDPGQINIGYLVGSAPGSRPVVVAGASRLQGGYALATSDGGVFCYDAPFRGSLPAIGIESDKPVVGMAWTRSGYGYWLAAADGGVFAFGDAPFHGAMSGRLLAAPIVGIAADPQGDGYWLAAAEGGVFAFGSAPAGGSVARRRLDAPVVGIAASPELSAFWLVTADGGVFALGVVPLGSLGTHPSAPVTGMCVTASGRGYWLLGEDGGVFGFGDASYLGSYPSLPAPARQDGLRRFSALVRNRSGGYTMASESNEHYAFTPCGARFPGGAAAGSMRQVGEEFREVKPADVADPEPGGDDAVDHVACLVGLGR